MKNDSLLPKTNLFSFVKVIDNQLLKVFVFSFLLFGFVVPSGANSTKSSEEGSRKNIDLLIHKIFAVPALTLDGGNLSYTENNLVTQVSPGATLVDADDNWNTGTLVVQITANNQGTDELSIPDNIVGQINTSGLNIFDNLTQIGTMDASEGTVTDGTALTITFNASATTAHVQQVIQAIHYRNTSDDPSGLTRDVTFTVTDDNTDTDNETRSIDFTTVNDEPDVSGTASNPTFVEDGGAQGLFSGTSVSTVETGQNIISFIIEVQNVADGTSVGQDETLTVDGVAIALNNGNTGNDAAAGTFGTLDFSVSESGGTSTVTINDIIESTGDVQSVLNLISYSNSSQDPTTTSRIVTVTSLQDDGGTANGGDDTNTSVALGSSTVAITTVNDEPTLGGTADDPTYNEDGTPGSIYSGTAVSTVEGSQNIISFIIQVTNVADGSSVGQDEILTVDGVAIALNNGNTGNDAAAGTFGTLDFSVSESGGTSTVTINDIIESTGDVQSVLNLITYSNNNNEPTTGTRVVTVTSLQDDGGTANGGDDTNTSVALAGSTVTVNAANDEPTLSGTASNPTFVEDGGAQGLFSGTAVSTVEGSQNIISFIIEIQNVADGTSVGQDETLTVDGVAIALNNGNTGNDAAAGTFGTLDFSVSESGGTSTVTINDIIESTGDVQSVLNLISYSNASQNPTTTSRIVTVTSLQDDGGTANGGDDTNTSVALGSSTVAITTVNDEPTLGGTADDPTYNEDGTPGSIYSGTAVSTVEGSQNIISFIIQVTNVADGSSVGQDEILTVDGVAIALNNGNTGNDAAAGTFGTLDFSVSESGGTSTVTINDIIESTGDVQSVLNLITYSNNNNEPTTGTRVVTVTSLQDDGGTANGGDDTNTSVALAGSTVTVNAANDEPTLSGTASNPTFVEDGGAQGLFSGTAVSTVEGSQNIISFIIEIQNVADGTSVGQDETLTVDGVAIALNNGNTGNDAAAGTFGTLDFSVSESGGTSTVTINDIIESTGDVQSVLNLISYSNASQNPTTTSRIVTVTSLQDDGGTANGGDDTNTSVALGSSTVAITTVNDEPTLSGTADNSTFTEGLGAVSIYSGTSVSTVEGSQNIISFIIEVTNVADGSSVGQDEILTVDGVAIALNNGNTGNDAAAGTFGTLDFSVSETAGTSTVTINDIIESTGDVQSVLNLITYDNSNDVPSTTSRGITVTSLQDDGGTANGGDDTNTSVALATSSIAITAVNDEPSFITTQTNPTFSEGGGAQLVYSSTDVNTIEGDNVIAFVIEVTNVTDGTDGDAEILNIDGIDVSLEEVSTGAGQVGGNITFDYDVARSGNTSTVTVDNFSTDEITFETVVDAITYRNTAAPPTNGNRGVNFASLQDAGGVANGGDDTNAAIDSTSNVAVSATNPASTLSIGDIIVIGQSGDSQDEFTWVPLVDIPAGEVIYFTNSGHDDAGVFVDNGDHFLMKYTTPGGGLAKGTKMLITDDGGGGGTEDGTGDYTLLSATDLGSSTDMFLFNQGDQILVFQSTDNDGAANFTTTDFSPIFALTTNSTVWEYESGSDASRYTSDLYTGLTNGTNAIAAGSGSATNGHHDNARYGGLVQGTSAEILAAVTTLGNWSGQSSSPSQGYTRDGVGTFRINEPPELDALTALSPNFTENGSAVSVFSGADVNTIESGNTLISFEVTVTNVTDGTVTGDDEFITVDGVSISLENGNSANDTGGTVFTTFDYSVSESGGTSTVTISDFSVTDVNLEIVLNGIAYSNSSEEPVGAGRGITITAMEDDDTFTTPNNTSLGAATSTVTVLPVNDEPNMTATGLDPSFTEGGSAEDLFSTVSVTNVESAETIIGFTITVTNVADGASAGQNEIINVDGIDISLQNLNSGNDAVATTFGTLDYSVSHSLGTSVITISDISESLSDVQTVIDNLTYENTSIPPSATARVVSVNDLQDSGGTANGGDDLNDALSVSSTVSIIQNLPVITNVNWLDANPTDGNIDQVRISFDVPVDFTDGDGAGGLGLDGFTGITFSTAPDYGSAPYQNVTQVVLDLATPIAGTALPANTLTYTSGGPNMTILRDGTSLELTNGEVVAAHSGTYSDGALPIITSAVTDDNDVDGTIDRLTINFSESVTVTDGGTDDDFTLVASVGTAAIDAGTYGVTATSVTYNITPSITGNTAITVDPTYVAAGAGSVIDAGSNEMADAETVTGTDGAAPAIIADLAMDLDADGDIDALELQFSEPITDTDVNPSDFELSTDGGSTTDQFNTIVTGVTGITTDPDSNDEYIRLTITTPANVSGTGASEYDYANSTVIDDAAGNQFADVTDEPATDGALPVILTSVTDDIDNDGTVDRLTVNFSESVTITDGGLDDDFTLVASTGTVSIDAGTYGTTATSVTYNVTPTVTDNTALTIVPTYAVAGAGSVIDAATNEMLNGETIAAGTDGAPPAIISAATGDNNGDGTVDRLVLTFSESVNVTDGGTDDDFTLAASTGSATIDAGTYTTGPTTTLTYNVTVTSTDNTTLTIDPTYVAGGAGDVTDVNGNEMDNGETVTGVDGAPTVLVSAVTDDNDGDGTVDRLTLTFSETVTYTDNGTDDDFTLAASTGSATIDAGVYGTVGTSVTFNVTVTETGNTALTINPTYVSAGAGSVIDGGAIEMVNGETVVGTDGASPAILIAATNDNSGNGTVDQLILTFSESVTVTDGGTDNDITLSASVGTASVDAGTYGTTGTTATYNITPTTTDNTSLTVDPTYSAAGAGDITDANGNEMNNAETVTGTDGARPAILISATEDTNGDGTVDRINLTFSESVTVTDGGTDNDFTLAASVGSASLVAGTYGTTGTTAFYNVSVTTTENTDLTIDPTYVSTGAGSIIDAIGNEMNNAETVTGTDGAAPALLSALTDDNNGDGTVDRLTLNFTESVTVTDGGTDDDFSLVASSGTASIDAGSYGTAGTSVTYNVTVTTTDNTALTIDPSYVAAGAGSVIDGSGNEMTDAETITGADGAPPAILIASTGDNDGDGTVDRLVLTFSESVTVTDGGLDDDFTLAASTGSATIDAGTYNASGTTATYNVTVTSTSNTILTIDPTYVLAGAGSVIDGSGNEMEDGETVTGIDGAPAVIVSAVTGDVNRDGTIDQLVITFSETVTLTDGGLDDDFTLVASSGSVSIDAGTYGTTGLALTYNITPTVTQNTAITVDPTYDNTGAGSVVDGGATEVANGETIVGSDGAPPAIIAATTIDADTDGQIDGMSITLSENIVDASSTIGGGTFNVDVYSGESTTTGTANDQFMNLTFSESGGGDTGVTPDVTLNPGTLSDGTNTLGLGQTFGGTTDGAAPAIVNFEYQDGNEDGFVDQFEVTFSESVTAASNLSSNDLNLTSAGDFTGASFGTNPTNEITGSMTSVVIGLGTASTVADTESAGALAISTQNAFSLTDGTNTNSTAIAQTWATFTDGAAPAILSAVTIDADTDGQIDGMTITLTENLDDLASTIGGGTFDVDTYGGEGATTGTGNDAIIDLTFTESGSGDTGITPNVTLNFGTLSDGTNLLTGSQSFASTQDGAAPAIFSMEYRDSDENGTIDQFIITYSEQIALASNLSDNDLDLTNAGDFTSAAFDTDPSDLVISASTSSTVDLGIDASVFDTEENSGFLAVSTQNGFSIQDGVGNVNNALTAQTWVQFIDGAAPLIAAASTVDNDRNGQIDGMLVTLSEDIDDLSSTIGSSTFSVDTYSGANTVTGTANDNLMEVTFTESGSADTDNTPTIFLNPGNLSDGTSILVGTQTFGGTTDGAGPAIISAVTDDVTENGQIDQVTVTFSEDITPGTLDTNASGGFDDFDVDGYTISAVALIPNDGATITLTESGGADTDNTPRVDLLAGEIDDASPATNSLSGLQMFNGTLDGAGPAIISAVTDDTDGNGQIDEIVVTFSEDINSLTIDTNPTGGFDDFSVDMFTIFAVTAFGSDGADLTLTESGTPDTDAVPDVTLAASQIEDGSANSTSNPQIFGSTADGAAPVLISAETYDTNDDGDVDRVEVELSEAITDTDVNTDRGDFELTPPGAFGTADAMTTFDTEVTGIAAVNVSNDEYFALEFTPTNSSGTGIFTLEYTGSGTNVVDGNSNLLSIPASSAVADGAAPRVKDITAPTTDMTPDDDATGVANTNQISVIYSEQVTWDAVNTDLFFVQQIPPLTTTYSNGLNEDLVNGVGNLTSATDGTVTIDIPYTTNANTDYYVVFESGSFVDAANNVSANQFNTASAWNFTTETALVVVGTTPSASDIVLELNDAPTISTNVPMDFTVRDGINRTYPVTLLSTGPGANDVTIDVDISAAVGDVTVDFDGVGTGGSGTADINAGVGTLQDFTGEPVNTDQTNPTMLSAVTDGINTITITFDDAVRNVGAVVGDFLVEDGASTPYAVTAIVDSIADNTLANFEIELTFADISSPAGDLFITYTQNAANDAVQDYGGNKLATQMIQIELDAVPPTIDDITIVNNTTLLLDFSETVQILSSSPANEFTLTDSLGNTFIVAAITDPATGDEFLELTTQDFTNADGDLTVDFTLGSIDVQDLGGNSLQNFSFTIDVNYNPTPSFVENFVNNASGDTNGDAIAMYRTNVAAATLATYSPLTISPFHTSENHTITIYDDAGLTNMIYQATNVNPSISPTLNDIFVTSGILDFSDGVDDNGVYTFYITETSTATPSTEGPAVQYSIALLDEVTNSAGGQSFGETDDVGTDLQITDHPVSQTLLATGNGLANITYAPGGNSTLTFVPSAAGIGSHQLSFEFTNDTTGVSAQFDPPEFLMAVNATSDVLFGSQSLFFAKSDGEAIIEVNNVLTGIEVGEDGTDNTSADFWGIEAYRIVNNAVDPVGGQLNILEATLADKSSVFSDGDDIADILMTYDGALSGGGIDGYTPTFAIPNYALNEWTFDPSAFEAQYGTGQSKDTVRLVSISDGDAGGSKAIIGTVDIFLYPDPVVTIQGVNTFYCEDDAPFTIQASIFTYVGTGGVDSLGNITNGYILNSGPADGGPYSLLVDNTGVTNIIDPAALGAGFYQIEYTSDPQTDAGTTATATFNFEVRAVETSPRLDETLVDAGSMTSLGDHGGFDGSNRYVFEFCSGETMPSFAIDTGTTGADGGNTEYNWYNADDDNLIASSTASLSPTSLFGTAIAGNGLTRDLYITRIVNGCESNSVDLTIRIFDNPDDPAIDASLDTDIFDDNGDYYFEYCASAGATITYDQLVLTTSLEDIPNDRAFVENRSYFRIYDSDASTQLFDLTYTGGPYTIDIASDITGVSTTASSDANGVVEKVFYISKVVADSTVFDGSAPFVGCESGLTQITAAIYTIPDIQIAGNAGFDGDPNITGTNPNEVVNYYMCSSLAGPLDFPEVGVKPQDGIGLQYEWFMSDMTTQISIADRDGELVTLSDLQAVGFNEAAATETTYTYYVRLRSNINSSSGFAGCTGPMRQVNITVFPDPVDPVITAPTNTSTGTTTGFDNTFNFCVSAIESGIGGLDGNTPFSAAVSYSGANNSQVFWYTATPDGAGLLNTNALAFGTDVTATDLGMDQAENDEFHFAVVHNTDIVLDNDGLINFEGCYSDTLFVQVNVSTVPATAFTFSGLTEDPDNDPSFTTTFEFFDANGSIVAANGLVFDVTDQSSNSVLPGGTPYVASDLSAFTHDFQNPGIYDATLTITTAAGCDSTITRQFEILEKIVVSGSYLETFDSDDGGWFAEFRSDNGQLGSLDDPVRTSSWAYGTPAGANGNLNFTYTGTGSAWSTTGGTENRYLGGEISYIYSPAFDISSLQDPALRFRTYRDLDGIKDGVVFQYSLDDGTTWVPLGSYIPTDPIPNSGQWWYNNNGISSSPGNTSIPNGNNLNPSRYGWADQYTSEDEARVDFGNGWVASTHRLGDVAGADHVRFRFALSASGTDTDGKIGDGFGFDEMEIFQLGKTVLVEHFSSAVTINSIRVDTAMTSLLNTDQVMLINYFTDLGNGEFVDPINERNTVSPGARTAYYGIDSAPNSVLDGEVRAQDEADELSWNDNDINIKGLEPARFDRPTITSTSTDPGMVSVTANYTAAYTATNLDLSFHFAIVENTVTVGAGSGLGGGDIGGYAENETISNVLRILLPGPAGFNYIGDVSPGEVFTYSVDWAIDNVYDASQLRVIAFVQDNTTKQVLQSWYLDVPGSETIVGLNDENSFSVYPNPADDLVTVEFVSELTKDHDWILFDQAGRQVLSGVIEQGSRALKINTEDVPSGMYFVTMFSEENERKVARVVVAH